MKKLDPKAFWLFFIGGFVGTFFSLVFFSFFVGVNVFEDYSGDELNIGFGILAMLAILLVSLPINALWSYLVYQNYKYELTEDGFRKELGVIAKKYVTIPYERIQNVDIYRGPIARILGLSDLNIQTAGLSYNPKNAKMGRSEGRLPGLSKEEAERVRSELISRAQGSGDQGL